MFSPKPMPVDELGVGEVGFIFADIKTVSDAQIGDTITEAARPTLGAVSRLQGNASRWSSPGSIRSKAASIRELRDALEKLRLNDASFFFEPETSAALGFGFRCGFLGLLHMEIVQERLEREFDMDLVTTAPGVLYRVTTTDGVMQEIDSPSKLPDAGPHREDRRADHHRDDADAGRARRRRSCSCARRSAACRSRSST